MIIATLDMSKLEVELNRQFDRVNAEFMKVMENLKYLKEKIDIMQLEIQFIRYHK